LCSDEAVELAAAAGERDEDEPEDINDCELNTFDCLFATSRVLDYLE